MRARESNLKMIWKLSVVTVIFIFSLLVSKLVFYKEPLDNIMFVSPSQCPKRAEKASLLTASGMLLHAFPSMFVSSLREFPESCAYKHAALSCFTNIDGKACNNIPEAVNKLAFSARLGH
jgi:hypothetical protein